MKNISNARIWTARGIAICADMVQIGLPFIFGEGFVSPFEDVLDVFVCFMLTLLVGWHIAFIPTFLFELAPIGDLAPTWTIAVLIATRKSQVATPPAIKPAVVLEDKKVG